MRKAIIEIPSEYLITIFPPDFFDIVEYAELKTVLKLDIEKGIKMLIIEIQMKKGSTLDTLKGLPSLVSILALAQQENKYICLLKIEYEAQQRVLIAQYGAIAEQLDVIFDTPSYITKEKLVLSFISDNKTMKTLLAFFKTIGPIKVTSIQEHAFSDFDLLSNLTEKQKEILLAAKKNGYYQNPRQITAAELAEKLGLSKSTTTEHLRKAENRLISSLLTGY